jgi:hypothetical protein
MGDKQSSTPLLKLPPEARAYAESRQHGNGYVDVEGLLNELSERGYQVSWGSAGRINKYLKQQAQHITEKTQAMRGVLDALGPHSNDMGLVNIALLTDALMEMQPELRVTAEEIREMCPSERMNWLMETIKAQNYLAKAQQPLKQERRTDIKENEARAKAMTAEIKRMAPGLDDKTAADIRDKLLYWEDK